MMRNKTSSSLQKTFDECFLISSTAVYFEGQVRLSRLDIHFSQSESWNFLANSESNREMRKRLSDHGGMHLTKSITITPIEYQQAMSRNQRPRKH